LTDKRFEKLKKMEFSWFVNVLKESFPAIQQKLHKLTDVARNLQITGQVGNVAELTAEEEEQWTSVGLLNISSASDQQTREQTRSHSVSGSRRLGMLGLRH
jgi:hypothetical protein